MFDPLSYLGQHASPGDDLSINGFTRLLFMICDGPKEAIQMLVYTVIMAVESLKAVRQVCAEVWRVIPFQGLIPQVKPAMLVIREGCEFLMTNVSYYSCLCII